jgi:four helix bundle protein
MAHADSTTNTTTNTRTVTGPERLDAYRLARELYRLVHDLAPHGSGLGDQLRRASASCVLTIAEGVGRSSARDQARFFAIARGSALECVAVLDLLEVLTSDARLAQARPLAVRVVQTTSGLLRRHRAP